VGCDSGVLGEKPFSEDDCCGCARCPRGGDFVDCQPQSVRVDPGAGPDVLLFHDSFQDTAYYSIPVRGCTAWCWYMYCNPLFYCVGCWRASDLFPLRHLKYKSLSPCSLSNICFASPPVARFPRVSLNCVFYLYPSI